MGKGRKQLSQAEVWDDSALIQSWDDALAEYKLYHSIHARSERVEDVIEEAEVQERDVHMSEDDLRLAAAGMQTNGISSGELEDGELEEEPKSAQAYRNGKLFENIHGPSTLEPEPKERLANASIAVHQEEKSGMPNAIINGVQDEALKNLMMSWYYAGYYTGLYKGQQRLHRTPSEEDR
ncbi:MAG: hypothetical protein Q9175_007389 [Cornicularia normoerica]